MPPEHGSLIDGVVRQSALRTFDECPLRAITEAEAFNDYSGPEAALGTAFHMVAEEAMRTMQRQGESKIPHEEAIRIMLEVAASPDCPHVNDDGLRQLRILVLQFAALDWPVHRIVAIEERMFADVRCPDGQTRRITGKPDLVFADPPGGAVVVDYKTGWSMPPVKRENTDESKDGGRPWLSERGTFQLDTLGYLIMHTYPAIGRVVLREYYPRLNDQREATLLREEMEHVEHRLGVLAQRFHEQLANDGPVPEPRPGKWCSHCPIARFCPVPFEARKGGAISAPDIADAEAARWVMVRALDKQLREGLKGYHEETGYCAEVGDGRTVRWRVNDRGSRSFDAHPPDEEPTA